MSTEYPKEISKFKNAVRSDLIGSVIQPADKNGGILFLTGQTMKKRQIDNSKIHSLMKMEKHFLIMESQVKRQSRISSK